MEYFDIQKGGVVRVGKSGKKSRVSREFVVKAMQKGGGMMYDPKSGKTALWSGAWSPSDVGREECGVTRRIEPGEDISVILKGGGIMFGPGRSIQWPSTWSPSDFGRRDCGQPMMVEKKMFAGPIKKKAEIVPIAEKPKITILQENVQLAHKRAREEISKLNKDVINLPKYLQKTVVSDIGRIEELNRQIMGVKDEKSLNNLAKKIAEQLELVQNRIIKLSESDTQIVRIGNEFKKLNEQVMMILFDEIKPERLINITDYKKDLRPAISEVDRDLKFLEQWHSEARSINEKLRTRDDQLQIINLINTFDKLARGVQEKINKLEKTFKAFEEEKMLERQRHSEFNEKVFRKIEALDRDIRRVETSIIDSLQREFAGLKNDTTKLLKEAGQTMIALPLEIDRVVKEYTGKIEKLQAKFSDLMGRNETKEKVVYTKEQLLFGLDRPFKDECEKKLAELMYKKEDKPIGKGFFGRVYGVCNGYNECLAMEEEKRGYKPKYVLKIEFYDPNELAGFLNEKKIYEELAKFDYRNTVRLHEKPWDCDIKPLPGHRSFTKAGYLIMERMDGTVWGLLPDVDTEISLKLISLIENFHQMGFAHHDTKLDNFLYKDLAFGRRKYVLADFGLSWYFGGVEKTEKVMMMIWNYKAWDYMMLEFVLKNANKEIFKKKPDLAQKLQELRRELVKDPDNESVKKNVDKIKSELPYNSEIMMKIAEKYRVLWNEGWRYRPDDKDHFGLPFTAGRLRMPFAERAENIDKSMKLLKYIEGKQPELDKLWRKVEQFKKIETERTRDFLNKAGFKLESIDTLVYGLEIFMIPTERLLPETEIDQSIDAIKKLLEQVESIQKIVEFDYIGARKKNSEEIEKLVESQKNIVKAVGELNEEAKKLGIPKEVKGLQENTKNLGEKLGEVSSKNNALKTVDDDANVASLISEVRTIIMGLLTEKIPEVRGALDKRKEILRKAADTRKKFLEKTAPRIKAFEKEISQATVIKEFQGELGEIQKEIKVLSEGVKKLEKISAEELGKTIEYLEKGLEQMRQKFDDLMKRNKEWYFGIHELSRNECEAKFQREMYKRGKELGVGRFGVVYEVCHGLKECLKKEFPYVVKIAVMTREDSNNEVKITKKLANTGLAVNIIDSWDCPLDISETGKKLMETVLKDIKELKTNKKINMLQYIVMDRWDGTLLDLIEKKEMTPEILEEIFNLIERLHKEGIVHFDVKPDNILYRRRNGKLEITLGDYGLAWDFREDPAIFKGANPQEFERNVMNHKAYDYVRLLWSLEDDMDPLPQWVKDKFYDKLLTLFKQGWMIKKDDKIYLGDYMLAIRKPFEDLMAYGYGFQLDQLYKDEVSQKLADLRDKHQTIIEKFENLKEKAADNARIRGTLEMLLVGLRAHGAKISEIEKSIDIEEIREDYDKLISLFKDRYEKELLKYTRILEGLEDIEDQVDKNAESIERLTEQGLGWKKIQEKIPGTYFEFLELDEHLEELKKLNNIIAGAKTKKELDSNQKEFNKKLIETGNTIRIIKIEAEKTEKEAAIELAENQKKDEYADAVKEYKGNLDELNLQIKELSEKKYPQLQGKIEMLKEKAEHANKMYSRLEEKKERVDVIEDIYKEIGNLIAVAKQSLVEITLSIAKEKQNKLTKDLEKVSKGCGALASKMMGAPEGLRDEIEKACSKTGELEGKIAALRNRRSIAEVEEDAKKIGQNVNSLGQKVIKLGKSLADAKLKYYNEYIFPQWKLLQDLRKGIEDKGLRKMAERFGFLQADLRELKRNVSSVDKSLKDIKEAASAERGKMSYQELMSIYEVNKSMIEDVKKKIKDFTDKFNSAKKRATEGPRVKIVEPQPDLSAELQELKDSISDSINSFDKRIGHLIFILREYEVEAIIYPFIWEKIEELRKIIEKMLEIKGKLIKLGDQLKADKKIISAVESQALDLIQSFYIREGESSVIRAELEQLKLQGAKETTRTSFDKEEHKRQLKQLEEDNREKRTKWRNTINSVTLGTLKVDKERLEYGNVADKVSDDLLEKSRRLLSIRGELSKYLDGVDEKMWITKAASVINRGNRMAINIVESAESGKIEDLKTLMYDMKTNYLASEELMSKLELLYDKIGKIPRKMTIKDYQKKLGSWKNEIIQADEKGKINAEKNFSRFVEESKKEIEELVKALKPEKPRRLELVRAVTPPTGEEFTIRFAGRKSGKQKTYEYPIIDFNKLQPLTAILNKYGIQINDFVANLIFLIISKIFNVILIREPLCDVNCLKDEFLGWLQLKMNDTDFKVAKEVINDILENIEPVIDYQADPSIYSGVIKKARKQIDETVKLPGIGDKVKNRLNKVSTLLKYIGGEQVLSGGSSKYRSRLLI